MKFLKLMSRTLGIRPHLERSAVQKQIGLRRWMFWAVVVGLLFPGIANAQTIDGNFSEWSSGEIIGTDPAAHVNPTDVADWLTLWATFQNGNLLISYQTVQNIDFNNNAWRYEVLLDTDSNPLTGYRGSAGNYMLGADYMVEGGTIYAYTGSGTNWSWSYAGTATYAIGGNLLESWFPLVGADLGSDQPPGAAALAVQSDGDIVTVGTISPAGSQDFALTRFNGNFGFDNSFGPITGLVTYLGGEAAATNFPGYNAAGTAMALQANGDIVAVGTVTNAQGGTSFLTARYR